MKNQSMSEDLRSILIKHKEKESPSLFSKSKIAHLITLAKLAECIRFEKAQFYCLSLAIERKNKKLEDFKVGELIDLIEVNQQFHDFLIENGVQNAKEKTD